MPRKKKSPDFENSLLQLETLVEKMEQGDLSLEEALQAFEEGVQLTKECQNILDQAEQKVQLLSEQGNDVTSTPFNSANIE